MAQQAVAGTSTARGRFGTFAGVFTPNVLTILGIILFLRTGWVVGEAGLWGALIIIGIANSISLLTGLSLSAIATSMDVGAGGNYYLISRSLGLEIGGAIGITTVVYVAAAIWFAYHLTAEQLITDALAMQQVARWPALILFGVWASTLSSALGSVLAAPRT